MTSGVSRKPLLARIFHRLPKSSAAHVPFRVRCVCGQFVTGTRRRQALELVCPKCGNKILVLPRSAWPPVTSSLTALPQPSAPVPPAPVPARKSHWRVWLLPLSVGLFALATAVWAVWVYGPQVARSARQDRRSYQEHAEAAHAALRQGAFDRAAHELDAGAKAWHRDGTAPDRDAQAAHYRLLAQARLLAELCPLSLEQTLAWAEEQEKQPPHARTDLKVHLPHRVFVFDTLLHAPPPLLLEENRHLRMDYQVFGTTLPVLLDLSGQEGLFKLVPQDQPQRWVFAVRLEAIHLRADEQLKGQWVLRFEPNSALLLTDPLLFQAWGLEKEIGLAAVLERQQQLHIAAPRWQVPAAPALKGATREELRARLQHPDATARQLWKQNYLEQWLYERHRLRISLHCANRAVPRVATWQQGPKP